MKHELKYDEYFDEAWNELKEAIKKDMVEWDCIDDEDKIKWPCYVCIFKREKEPMFKH